LAEERTDLAARRTVMAADRTLMAWVRTGLSMTSFGFTIYKLLQAFQSAGSILPNENSPRRIGLFLTGLGTVSILIGTIEYWQTLRDLRRIACGSGVRRS
jgi:putative membrane protein